MKIQILVLGVLVCSIAIPLTKYPTDSTIEKGIRLDKHWWDLDILDIPIEPLDPESRFKGILNLTDIGNQTELSVRMFFLSGSKLSIWGHFHFLFLSKSSGLESVLIGDLEDFGNDTHGAVFHLDYKPYSANEHKPIWKPLPNFAIRENAIKPMAFFSVIDMTEESDPSLIGIFDIRQLWGDRGKFILSRISDFLEKQNLDCEVDVHIF